MLSSSFSHSSCSFVEKEEELEMKWVKSSYGRREFIDEQLESDDDESILSVMLQLVGS